ncbi:hypothetical protein SNE40_015782 [Patella caerulea]|uniref:IgGFc-binding protein N-terminal domain-containing protein n=1 Tax=Patella caerulea TaxID=87958 RepID=A0AAN8JKM0_PATCE
MSADNNCIFFSGIKSYPGREFLLAFPQNYINNNENVEIVFTCVSTTDIQVNLTFHAPDSFAQPATTTFSLAPDERYVISLSAGIRMPTGSVIDTRCVEVISTGDITVVVFSRQGSNGDAYMALPISLLGQVYVSANYDNRVSGSASFIVITAPFNDSKISIRVPDFKNIVSFMFDDRLYSSEETIVVTLSAYQVLQLQVKDDLTGTHIVSDKPISVLSGVNRTSVYQETCRSHVMDSLPPVRRLGYQYVTITEPKYREPTIYRIVATEVATRVEMGTNIIILNNTGDFYESIIEPNNFYFIQSSKPVLVAQLSTSNYNNTYRSGDPSMVILTPLQAARDSYTFSVVNYSGYKVYVTIVINSSDVSGLRLNNQTITTTWTAVTGKQNLVVGEVLITTSLAVSQKVSNGNGGKFLAYIQGVTTCEGYSFGLTFQETTNTPVIIKVFKLAEEIVS